MRSHLACIIPAGLLLGVHLGLCGEIHVPDGDMEQPGLGPWRPYGTPVTVEKTTFSRSGKQALRVVTDNRDAVGGGKYEGVSRDLGRFRAGDALHISFWFRPGSGRDLAVGVGPTYFMRYWVLSGTDWTRADLSFRVPRDDLYRIWISQHNAPTEFFLDDFAVELEKRPNLGTTPRDRRLTLEGGPLRLLLDRDTGAICGILNRTTGESIIGPGRRTPLFRLERLAADGAGYERLTFERFRLDRFAVRSPREARLAFVGKDIAVRLEIRITLTRDGAAEFAGVLRNHSDRPVTAVTLPALYGVRPEGELRDLTLVDPHVGGRIVRDAWNSDGCRTTWPGRGVMGWLDLAGAKGGLYLASHDKAGIGTRLLAVPAPGGDFDLSITKEVLAPPGKDAAVPPVVLAVHAGDWHAAADRYRTWAQTWLPRPDIPAWLRNCDGWVLTGIQNGIMFRQLPDIYRSAEWMGVDFLHVQGEGIDNMWFDADGKQRSHPMTYPFPSPRFGTPAELETAVRRIHARGGYVMFYFLFERWTPSHSISDDFGTGRRSDVPAEYQPPALGFYADNALVAAPGARIPTEQPFMAERVMCLAAPGWQEWMRRWAVDVYAKRFGADGFYWDVMGRRGPFRCFNTRHGHHGENLWAKGCAGVLDTVVRQGRRINPDYSCAIEGCSDFLSPWVGFHLMSGATRTPNVFRYTFPEVLCVDGFSNTSWNWTQVEKARRVFLDGERFDLHGMHQAVRPIILLRKRIKPFIDWPAVFRDTVGITVSDQRVQARVFLRKDAGNAALALTMMNEPGVANTVIAVEPRLLGGELRTAHLFRFDGRVEPFVPKHDDHGRLLVPVPRDPVSAAVLVHRTGPNLAVWAWMEQILRPGEDGLALTLFFPDGKRRPVDVNAALPPGLKGVFRTVPSEGAGIERRELRDPRHLRGLTRWRRVNATVRCGRERVLPWTVIAPPLVNGDFEAVDKDGRLVYWGALPCSDSPPQGRFCIRVDREHMPRGHVRLLTPLKPNCRYRFRCRLKRDIGATGGVGAHLVEYLEGSKFVRSAVLNSRKSGVWENLETTFVSQRAPRTSAIYLYNFDKEHPAWFDALELEEVRE